MSWRARLTRMLLWISVFAWGILLGGKLFDHEVLVGAWSLSPPESLSLLPYGPRFPVDTGYDWLRIVVGAIGLACSVRAISVPFPTPQNFKARSSGL